MAEDWVFRKRQRVHDWTLIEPLGHGASAEVWRAQRPGGPAMALKILVSRDLPNIVRFVREIEIMTALPAAIAVPIEDEHLPGAGHPPACYAMPVARSLKERLREGGMGARERGLILLETAICLHKLHELGTFHCDVKPANMLQVGGHWLFGDFGLAMRLRSKPIAAPDELLGSRHYIAPELYEDFTGAGPDWAACDAFSFGRVMFVVLSGAARPPSSKADLGEDQAALRRIAERYPEGPWLAEIVCATAARDPAARPALREVASALTGWLQRNGMLAPVPLAAA